ncbi:MAG: dTDP-4-dehydrorhamnose reductase [Alphaproteobacteria bacterium]
MVKKTLIIGSNGQVARNLKKILQDDCISLSSAELDLSKTDQIPLILDKFDFDVIINAAAYTQVDKAEEEFDKAYLVNGIAPGIIAQYAKEKNKTFIHYSTDYVFKGSGNTDLKETDQTNPISNYGKTKLIGEEQIRKLGGKYLILRTSAVFDSEGHNFVRTMLKLGKEREELRIVNDQFTSPTYAFDLAEATLSLIQKTQLNFNTTIYHVCNSGKTTWYEFAKTIFDLAKKYQIPTKVKNIYPITTMEYPLPAKRPAYSVLACNKLYADYMIKLPNWQESLEKVINLISNQKEGSK